MLSAISGKAGNTDIAISVVTLIELAHGAARADTSLRKEKRQQFIQELLRALPMHPVTVSLALRVGQIDGENQAKGIRLPLSDLLIGVTALELGLQRSHGQSPPLQDDSRLVGCPVLVAGLHVDSTLS
jgi:predicted nucleic acid-binding protein